MIGRNAYLAQASVAEVATLRRSSVSPGRPALELAACDAAAINVAVAAQFADLAAGGGAPEWVQLLPLGQIKALDGREWHNADPRAVLAATEAIGRDLPVDYDHSIDAIKERGGTAPAAGWIKKLELRADGIYGQVEWTERARAALAAKEWRFISPVFQFDKNSRAVLRILRAALTNDPAIAELKAVAHQVNPELAMNKELIELLAKIFGLDTTKVLAMAAAEQQAELARAAAAYRPPSAETASAAAASAALAPIAKALGLAETAKAEEITTTLATTIAAAKNPDPTKFAPIAVVNDLKDRVTALEQGGAEAKATAAVEKAMADGKLTPAMKDWALALAKKDMKAFDDFVGKAPVVVVAGKQIAGTPTGDASSLTDAEKAMCRNLGLSEEALLKTKKAESLAEGRA